MIYLLAALLALFQYTIPQHTGATAGSGGGTGLTFTHSQGGSNTGSASGGTVVLSSTPGNGDVLTIAVMSQTGSSLSSVAAHDNASPQNNFTVSTSSPSPFLSGSGQVWLLYLIEPNGSGGKTITVTFTGSGGGWWVDDFSVSGGSATYDKDACSDTGSGTTVNTPTITPTESGELLYSGTTVINNVTAPTAGSTLGIWTGAAGAIFTNMAEYLLNSGSGSTAVDYTQSSSGGWSGCVMAFK